MSKKNGEVNAFTWDLDLVASENKWTVLEQKRTDSIPFIGEMNETGTLVLWEKLDRLTGVNGSGKANYDRIISEAQDYLSLVFHRYLAGERGLKRIKVNVNNRTLDPIDPFNVSNQATQPSPVENVCPGVTMQAFTLPHRSNYASDTEYEKFALPGGYLKNQGVFLYRAKRLILHGTWFEIAKKTALTQLCRVKIDIDVNQDEAWKIDVKKVSAQLPEEVRASIKQLIAHIGAPSKRVYRRRGARLTRPEVYPAWNAIKLETRPFIALIAKTQFLIASIHLLMMIRGLLSRLFFRWSNRHSQRNLFFTNCRTTKGQFALRRWKTMTFVMLLSLSLAH